MADPSAPQPRLSVRVPASTSNLGPGFDVLGLALALHVDVRVLGPARSGAHELASRGGFARDWPADGTDLLFRAFELTAGTAARGGLAFEADSAIPVARGLGSSAAATVAGLLLGAAVAERDLGREDLLALAIELEGHPDNAAPALFGGLCLCLSGSSGTGSPLLVRHQLHPSLAVALAWPDRTLSTERARAALPEEVPFADAVENPRRLAFLLEGLRTGSPELLMAGGLDRLHVRHRLPLIPGGEAALAAARDAGAWLATVSGSGTALVSIAPHAAAPAVADAMAAVFLAETGAGTGRVVEAVREAPEVARP